MKKYFVVYGKFSNQYALFWTTNEGLYPDAPDYKRKFNTAEFVAEYPIAEQITRKQALALARAERKRRRENGMFSGYADRYIHPYGAAWYDPAYAHLHTDNTGVIVEA